MSSLTSPGWTETKADVRVPRPVIFRSRTYPGALGFLRSWRLEFMWPWASEEWKGTYNIKIDCFKNAFGVYLIANLRLFVQFFGVFRDSGVGFQLSAGLLVAEGRSLWEFAPTELHLGGLLLNHETHRPKCGALVTPIAKRLNRRYLEWLSEFWV